MGPQPLCTKPGHGRSPRVLYGAAERFSHRGRARGASRDRGPRGVGRSISQRRASAVGAIAMKRGHACSRSRTSAQALLWMTLAIPLFLTMAGLAIDGGALLDSRRDLQSVADGAARAGATRIDMQRLRTSGGADVELDSAQAMHAARAYVDQS